MLHAMAELHRVSTPKFVARNIAAVESRPTSATLCTTNFFVYPPSAAFRAIVWCKFQCSANQISHSNLTADLLFARGTFLCWRNCLPHGRVLFFNQRRNQRNEMVEVIFVHSKVLHERTGVFRGQLSYYPVECPHLLPPGYPASYPNTAISSFTASFLLAI